MFTGFLQSFLGVVVALVAVFIGIVLLVNGAGGVGVVIALAGIVGGSFLRYLSRQTVRVR